MRQFLKPEGSSWVHHDLETEPGAIGAAAAVIPAKAILRIPPGSVGGQGELQNILMGGQAPPQRLPVLFACLENLRQPPQLHRTYRRQGIQRSMIEAQMAVVVLWLYRWGSYHCSHRKRLLQVLSMPEGHQQSLPQSRKLSASTFSFW